MRGGRLTGLVTILAIAVGACAAPAGVASEVPHNRPAEALPTPARDGDTLSPEANYEDLLRAMIDRTERRAIETGERCLLARGPRGIRIAAERAPALRNTPPTEGSLSTRLARAPVSTVHVLTVWGAFGPNESDVVLATMTASPPPRPARVLVLFLVPTGVYVRATETDLRLPATALSNDELGRVLDAMGPDYGTWVVTADAETPLARLVGLLSELPESAPPVTLAAALPPGTRVPSPPAPTVDAHPSSCPGGLPSPPSDWREGDVDPRALRATLEPMQAWVSRCRRDAAPQAPDGTLELLLRLAPDGRVEKACVGRDEVGSAALRACIVERTRELHFAAPSPAGFVDLALPIRLAADDRLRQRPLCAGD